MPVIGVVEEIGRKEVEWRILNFPSLLDGKDNDWCASHTFGFSDGSWFLQMWPNWQREAGNPASGWVVLDLIRCDRGPPATVRFSVGIKGSGGVEKSREGEKEFQSYSDFYHWDDFCSRSYLLEHRTRLMPDDTFTIRCVLKRPGADRDNVEASTQTDEDCKKAAVPTEENQSSEKQGVEELGQSLHRLLESKKDCDVIIKVQDKEFPAHRLILQARSAVFGAMFSHDMVEKQSGVVNMQDCDPETFPDFLEHVYTGSFEMISSSNVFSLYACSDKYDMGALKQECSKFIKKNMAVASFCEAITLAIKHDDRALMEYATEFFCNNSINIVKTAEWQKFLIENAIVGNELFIKLLSKHKDIFVPGS